MSTTQNQATLVSYVVDSHLGLLKLLTDPLVLSATFSGHAIVPFVELVEFSGCAQKLSYISTITECLNSFPQRSELSHRMNDYLLVTLQAPADWFISCIEIRNSHFLFCRGRGQPLIEIILTHHLNLFIYLP